MYFTNLTKNIINITRILKSVMKSIIYYQSQSTYYKLDKLDRKHFIQSL